MDEPDEGPGVPDGAVPSTEAVEVFWRPGCPFCSRLRRELTRRNVEATWHNIWDDGQARALVRSANAGNETVPTVRIGTQILTNPSWRQLAPLLGAGPWRDETVPASRSHSVTRIASWLPVAFFVIISLGLTFSGHDGVAWGADAMAVAAWWFTRSLRR